jgi:hypothetical protein
VALVRGQVECQSAMSVERRVEVIERQGADRPFIAVQGDRTQGGGVDRQDLIFTSIGRYRLQYHPTTQRIAWKTLQQGWVEGLEHAMLEGGKYLRRHIPTSDFAPRAMKFRTGTRVYQGEP